MFADQHLLLAVFSIVLIIFFFLYLFIACSVRYPPNLPNLAGNLWNCFFFSVKYHVFVNFHFQCEAFCITDLQFSEMSFRGRSHIMLATKSANLWFFWQGGEGLDICWFCSDNGGQVCTNMLNWQIYYSFFLLNMTYFDTIFFLFEISFFFILHTCLIFFYYRKILKSVFYSIN